MKQHYGYTLLEQLTVIAIIAIASTMAYLNLRDLQLKLEATQFAESLARSLNEARLTAIANRQPITICPSEDSAKCDAKWTRRYLLFNDTNGNRVQDGEEKIFSSGGQMFKRFKVRWSSFQKMPALKWTTLGTTASQNGSFIICPLNNDNRFARAVIITKTGRVRTSGDKNNDGVHEGTDGKPLACK